MDRSLQEQILMETFYNFPICNKPFEQLSNKIGIDEAELMEKIISLKSSGHIRQIGPVFDYKTLGYEGTLLAAKIKPGKIEDFDKLLFSYSGVTHSYLRDSEYNIWFTYVYKGEDEFADFFDVLLMHPSCDSLINLPKKKSFKNSINFKEGQQVISKDQSEYSELAPHLEKVIDSLQQDLRVSTRPFLPIAGEMGIGESDLLQSISELQEQGFMKRFGARLNHTKAGLSYNALYVSQVNEKTFSKVAGEVTSLWNVSHCYTRYQSPDWLYNLYIMVHGRSESELSDTIQTIKRLARVKSDAILYTKQELIKRRPVLLSEGDCRLVA